MDASTATVVLASVVAAVSTLGALWLKFQVRRDRIIQQEESVRQKRDQEETKRSAEESKATSTQTARLFESYEKTVKMLDDRVERQGKQIMDCEEHRLKDIQRQGEALLEMQKLARSVEELKAGQKAPPAA